MLARYILHTREVSAVITFVVRRLCRLLVTDAQSVRRQALDAVKKVRWPKTGEPRTPRALAPRGSLGGSPEPAGRRAGNTEDRSASLIDPLRKEPRFEAIERELKFSSN